jgi:hypothetical protein
MSVEHRRQLLAFFIVALAAVLMIGSGLSNRALPDALDGGPHGGPARQAGVASSVSLLTGQPGIEPGGSARGTTAAESEPAQAKSGAGTDRPGRSQPSLAKGPTVVRSDRTPSAKPAGSTTRTDGPRRVGKAPLRVARTSSGRIATEDGTSATHAKKVHGKKSHAKKHARSRHHG